MSNPSSPEGHSLQNKMVSIWSDWTNSAAKPTFVLGRRYDSKEIIQQLQNNTPSLEGGSAIKEEIYDLSLLNIDIQARLWLTYRTGFEPIRKVINGPQPLQFMQSMIFNRNIVSTIQNLPSLTDNESFTTDIGWGCMIRTSQCLLANAYQILLLGREYSYHSEERVVADDPQLIKRHYDGNDLEFQIRKKDHIHNRLIDMFKDNSQGEFSIHNFIKVAGESPLQVLPGQWFGPNAASLSIKRLCDKWAGDELVPNLNVMISESADLYEEEVEKELHQNPNNLLILLPIRLGIDNISEYYHKSLFELFNLKQCVGIAGGKPSSSYYFFGYQGNRFLYLDPHYPQIYKPNYYESYHTSKYSYLDVTHMDPSMMVGIIIKNLDDFYHFKLSCQNLDNKIIHFYKSHIKERTPTEPKRKMSEFTNISAKDTQDDVFINVDNEENETDFVDLGNDLDSIEDMQFIKDDHVVGDEEKSSALLVEPLKVNSNTDDFEKDLSQFSISNKDEDYMELNYTEFQS